jgi:hypothetical protein
MSAERPYCLPGCDRLDGHDGRDPGACMQGGAPLHECILPRLPGCNRLDEHECGPLCDGRMIELVPVKILSWARQEADWAALGACSRQPSWAAGFGTPCSICHHAWYLHLGCDFCVACRTDIMGRELMSRQVLPGPAGEILRGPAHDGPATA